VHLITKVKIIEHKVKIIEHRPQVKIIEHKVKIIEHRPQVKIIEHKVKIIEHRPHLMARFFSYIGFPMINFVSICVVGVYMCLCFLFSYFNYFISSSKAELILDLRKLYCII